MANIWSAQKMPQARIIPIFPTLPKSDSEVATCPFCKKEQFFGTVPFPASEGGWVWIENGGCSHFHMVVDSGSGDTAALFIGIMPEGESCLKS